MTPTVASPIRSRLRLAALLACGGISAAGCLIVVPMIPPVKVYAPSPREVLVTGATTRSDVVMALGCPDSRHYDDRYFVYGWTQIYAAGAVAGGSGEVVWNSHRLVMEFAPDGRLVGYAEVSAFQAARADTKARKWIEAAERGGP